MEDLDEDLAGYFSQAPPPPTDDPDGDVDMGETYQGSYYDAQDDGNLDYE